jgi:TPR repeat protein
MAAIALAGFAVSVTLSFVLVRVGWKEGGEGLLAHALAWPLALAGVGAVAWMAGYQYHYRSLRDQDACLSGRSERCYSLARDERFSASERLLFAKLGCEGGSTGACSLLAGRLGAAQGTKSPEVAVLAAQCNRGNADVCLRLAAHLLGVVRDREGASSYLSRACETTVDRCSQAAKLADAQGESAIAEGLLRRGCERDDPTSCRSLLRKLERSVPEAEREQLHLRVCLITDVNECMPLIRRDAARFCPVICEGTTENRMQSCDHCARHAAEIGERALADRWWGGTCERGHMLSCVNLGLMYDELGQRNQAAPWFSKACDKPRNVTLGCHYLERPSPSKGAALSPSGRAGPRISR